MAVLRGSAGGEHYRTLSHRRAWTGPHDGTLDCIHHALYVECRERGKREASPTAAIIDSQSVKER